MLFRVASALAVLALASQAVAEEMTHKLSARDIFGLQVRDGSGYQPTSKFCKMGATCAEACGAGYQTCPSSDNAIHCFNQGNKEICCSDLSGNSCDAGFFCASHATNGTLCCPAGKSTDECAKSYGLSGPLVSQGPAPTNYPTAVVTGSSTHAMTYAPSATYPASNTTINKPPPTTTPATVTKSGASLAGPGAAVLLGAALVALL